MRLTQGSTRGLNLPPELPETARRTAVRVYRHLGLSCRVDVVANFRLWSAAGFTEAEDRRYLVNVSADCLRSRSSVRNGLEYIDAGGPYDGLTAILAHELRHVWQFESGRLHVIQKIVQHEAFIRWTPGLWTRIEDCSDRADRPWERDACGFSATWLTAVEGKVRS